MRTTLSLAVERALVRCFIPIVMMLLTARVEAIVGGEKQNVIEEPPTRLVVKYRPGTFDQLDPKTRRATSATADRLAEIHRQYDVVEETPLLRATRNSATDLSAYGPLGRTYVVEVSPGTDIEAAAAAFRALDFVESAQPDYPLEFYDAPNDAYYDQQWALNNTGQDHYEVFRLIGDENDTLGIVAGEPDADIDELEVYENPPLGGSTVIVGVVDSGVDPNHPDLAGALWTNPGEIPGNGLDDDRNGVIDDVHGVDIVDWTGELSDDFGHGTHCAGIIGAVTNNGIGVAGICPDARIMGVECYPFTLVPAAQGIIYAVDNGADVISMSWGAGWPLDVVYDALLYARSRGVVLIAAVGNDGYLKYNYPASYEEVVAVGATDSYGEITSFSTISDSLDVCAPGMGILSLRATNTDMYGGLNLEGFVHVIGDDYYLASGTSMAAPHAAGVAAYLRSLSPGLSHDYIRTALEESAVEVIDPYGTGAHLPGWDRYSGHGQVNLNDAIAYGVPMISARLQSPQRHAILSGPVDIEGTADGAGFTQYILEYGIGESPETWIEITSSAVPVTDGILGNWTPPAVNGIVVLRLRVGDDNAAYLPVCVVSGTSANITSPNPGTSVSGYASVAGTAYCPDFAYALIEYGEDEEPASYEEIATITAPSFGGPMVSWNCTGTPDGTYRIRLSVYSSTGLEASDETTVVVEAPFAPPDGWVLSLGTSGRAPTYCDIDRDGDHEIILGTPDGIKVVNTDGTLQTTGLPTLPDGDFRIIPAVGCLDNDGIDEDIIFLDTDGNLYGFPTSAPPFSVTANQAPDMSFLFLSSDHIFPCISLVDLDGDGLDEIFYFVGGASYTHDSPMFEIFESDGSPWTCGALYGQDDRHCLPADLDGDGEYEIYCVSVDDITQYDNCWNEVATLALERNGYPFNSATASLSAVDVDYDGTAEIILQGAYGSTSEQWMGVWVYAIDNGLTVMDGWPHPTYMTPFAEPYHVVFGDLNGDGALEYASAYTDLENSWFCVWNLDGTAFSGSSESTGEFTIYPNPGMTNAPMMADLNGDMKAELFAACNPDYYNPMQDFMFERIVSFDDHAAIPDNFPLTVSYAYDPTVCHNATVGDIDGDGAVDITYSSETGILVFRNFPEYRYHPSYAFNPMVHANRQQSRTTIFGDYTNVDGDDIPSEIDNCPYDYNPGQEDGDGDGIGDACECCTGKVGDANGSGQEAPTIGDISMIIDAKFISEDCENMIPCPDEADINQSGAPNATCEDITIGDISLLIDYLFITGPENMTLPDCQ